MKHPIRKDSLWKGVIEDLAADFLKFFFPKVIEKIDFERPFVFLDTELAKLFPAAEVKDRHADKLIKVFLKNGEEKYFLVHVEVQGYDDHDFAWRMFQCMYRLIEKYQVDITALAIYTSNNSKVHFKSYRRSFLSTELNYKFNTFILKDHHPEKLATIENPFAIALEAAWHNLQVDKLGDSARLEIKLTIARKLFRRGYDKKKVKCLLDFIKFYVNFEVEKNFDKFDKALTKSDQPMGIREAILQDAREQGIEEGEISGALKQAKESIKNMLAEGFEVAKIARLLGLEEEKVAQLIEELKEEGILT